ncbi:MAG: sensor histidine kinase [Candidatus Dormibacteraeota bacterium]|nr:sensor histidine kinase [Candidatus Dormibacteraeota bacterium]MBO0761690.1 sensor histidine kinase [Candidatus Dormibacteraeota bacterium]
MWGSPHQPRRVVQLLWAGIWLFYLGFPVTAMLNGHHAQTEVVARLAGLGAFLVVYLGFWAYGFKRSADLWPVLGALALLLAIAVPMALTDAHADEGWAQLYIYVAVVAGSGFRWPRTVIAVGAVAALGVVTTLLTAGLSWYVGLIGFEVMTIGLAMAGMTGIIRMNRELREAREEIGRLAVTEERLRFARDLHDLLGHSLSVIVLKAELASKMASRAPERSEAEVRDIERVARDALREVREAVAGYRQPSLSQELTNARTTLEAAGIDVRVDVAAGAFPATVDSTLAWAAREAATNVIRHSRARRVAFRLARDDGEVQLDVTDDGPGSAAAPGAGNGLRGLGERVEAQGGTLEFGPGADGGFHVAVRLPLSHERREETASA